MINTECLNKVKEIRSNFSIKIQTLCSILKVKRKTLSILSYDRRANTKEAIQINIETFNKECENETFLERLDLILEISKFWKNINIGTVEDYLYKEFKDKETILYLFLTKKVLNKDKIFKRMLEIENYAKKEKALQELINHFLYSKPNINLLEENGGKIKCTNIMN